MKFLFVVFNQNNRMHYLAIIPWLKRDLIEDSIIHKKFKSYFTDTKIGLILKVFLITMIMNIRIDDMKNKNKQNGLV